MRSQSNVAHDRDAGVDDLADRVGNDQSAFQLDRLRAALLQEASSRLSSPPRKINVCSSARGNPGEGFTIARVYHWQAAAV